MYVQITDGKRVTVGLFKKNKWKDVLYDKNFKPTHWKHLAGLPGE